MRFLRIRARLAAFKTMLIGEISVKKATSLLSILALTFVAACSNQGDSNAPKNEKAAAPQAQTQPAPQQQAAQDPHAGHTPAQHAAMGGPAEGPVTQAKVTKVTHASGYTYLEVDLNGKSTWVAASPANVKTGDTVAWSGGAVMHNFTSKSLRRTFDEIIFVNTVSVVN